MATQSHTRAHTPPTLIPPTHPPTPLPQPPAPGRSRPAPQTRGQTRSRRGRSGGPAWWPCQSAAAPPRTAACTCSSSPRQTRRRPCPGGPPLACGAGPGGEGRRGCAQCRAQKGCWRRLEGERPVRGRVGRGPKQCTAHAGGWQKTRTSKGAHKHGSAALRAQRGCHNRTTTHLCARIKRSFFLRSSSAEARWAGRHSRA